MKLQYCQKIRLNIQTSREEQQNLEISLAVE